MRSTSPETALQPDPAQVLSQAVVRAAELFAINQPLLAQILGLSQPTVSRLCAGSYVLAENSGKAWELATLFVRLFRSLDALVGSNDQAAVKWLTSTNHAFNARPLDRMLTAEGLVHVLQYLDAARGRI